MAAVASDRSPDTAPDHRFTLWPGSPRSGAFALVYAAAMICAAMQAPLSGPALVLELTHSGFGLFPWPSPLQCLLPDDLRHAVDVVTATPVRAD